MEQKQQKRFMEGDWIRGKTRRGELVHGYLLETPSPHSKLSVKVVFSDNENVTGQVTRLDQKNVELLEDLTTRTEEELQDLIDLALATKDEEWFIKLSTELRENQNKQGQSLKGRGNYKHEFEKTNK
ncbi:IDEAL domain-containing protein [Gracilibacillus sp. YIM 98692]|uniref:IDEAL domain-containing protein n=1 Tax=Gracilibacillus sp. YIM 98692 TaxID=2663532 RepID=UPI0013D42895|nr:IDEAL domain-containing protein [Gracilibacillus sp. YIM 98692]